MTAAPSPSITDERRLAALRDAAVLDTPAEEGFDDIVHLAAQACRAPIALVSLVDRDRQWFKARLNFPPCETDLDRSVCRFALDGTDLLEIADLAADPRTADNPLVTGEPHIRFYAGAPLRAEGGHVLGSLCVIDHRPRPAGLTGPQKDALRRLARQVVAQLELRRAMAGQRRMAGQREILIRTQAAVSAAGDDLDAALAALLDGAMETLPSAEGGTVQMIDGDALDYRAVRGTLAPHRGLRVPLDGSASGACARGGRPVLVVDALADARVKRDLIRPLRLRSSVHAAVARRGRVIGVLTLQSSAPGAFAEADLQLVQLLANTVSAGLAEVGEAAARRAERAGEARYRAVFESIVDYAIVVLDLDGTVTDWNSGAEKVLGGSAAEMRGRPADVFFTPEDRADGVAGREMHSALTEGRGADERWHLRKGGERFWASGEMMALRDEAGTAVGFVKVLRDRTEQRLVEERLRTSDERLQMALAASGVVGLWDWMVDTDLLHGDANFARLYGLDAESAAAGLTMAEYQIFVVPEDLARLRAEIRDVFERGADFLTEYRLALPGRPLRWVECKGRMIRDAEGRPFRFSGTAVDVTARKATETALREREEQLALERGLLRAVLHQAPTGVAVAFADGGSLFNRRAEAMLEQGSDGRHFPGHSAVHADGRPYGAEDIPTLRALTRGEVIQGEPMRHRGAAGDLRRWTISSAPVRDGAGAIVAAVSVFSDVEDQLRDREALARNEERLRLAFAASGSLGWFDWNVPADRLYAGEAFARMFTVDPAAAADGAPLSAFVDGIHPDDREHVGALIAQTLATGGPYEAEYRLRHADGAVFWAYVRGHCYLDEAGGARSFTGVAIDVTARKEAEEALRRSQDQLAFERNLLEAIFLQVPIGISIVGGDPQVPSLINARAEAMLGHGIGAADASRYHSYGAVHADGRPYAPAEYPSLRALRQGEVVRAEDMPYRRGGSGEPRLFEVSSSPVRDGAGRIQAAATVFADITDRRQAERQLRRLALIIEQSSDFIGIADAEGRVEYVNPAGRALVGLADEAAARASRVVEYFLPEDLPFVEASIMPPVLAGGSWSGDFRFRDFATGAPVPVRYNQFSLKGERGEFEGYAAVSHDISARKAAEAQRDILHRELAHRLKNTLAMVQAIVTQTLRSTPDVTAARDALAARLYALGKAHDLLITGQRGGAEMRTLIEDALRLHDDGRPGRFTIDGPSVFCGDRAALSLVLMMHELATNAAKYGALRAPDGSVAIGWALGGDPADPELRLHWEERGGPPVAAPTRRGFGSRLIERGLAGAVGGEVSITYPPAGVTCRLVAPLSGFAG